MRYPLLVDVNTSTTQRRLVMGFTILGTGSALPARSVSNDELSEFLDTSDEWIFTRTGIKSRHVCTTESLDDLAAAASERALQVSGIDASQLDLIVCSTTTGDHLVPAEACAVAERLDATCPAFDVSAACAGFVFALDVAEGYIARGRAKLRAGRCRRADDARARLDRPCHVRALWRWRGCCGHRGWGRESPCR